MRVKKWREDAQPEWPEAASGTQAVSAIGAGTQTFPETGVTRVPETRAPSEGLLDAGGADGAPDFPGAPRADRASGFPEPPGRRSVVRDPWDESDSAGESGSTGESGGAAGQTHDPDEVTVQLDGGSADNRSEGKPAGDSGSEGSDGPVFVDESGRRSRRFRRIGFAVGIACAVYALVIVVTLLSGNSNAPWVPMTGPKDDAPAGKVDTSPAPAESAKPSVPVGVLLPGVTPSVGAGVTPAPGVSGTAPGATVSPGRPGASTAPSATATQPGGNPSASTLPSATPTQSVNPPAGSPSPTPPVTTSPEPSVAPSESAGGGSTGPGTVADGPAEPSPLASETSGTGTTAPAAPPDAPLAPSSEHIV
ncbi:hypothetical protein [Streptomyces sp. NPDC005374]|uniref:hypothetical protein n=1 Tax=Streptomyces sp. NPDC005374 TaxID=3364713 RepID=UPI003674C6A4